MNRLQSSIPAAIIIAALIFLRPLAPAYGSGFGIFTQGASALGQADAVVAHNDGPSALFFNPALMSQLAGTQVEIGTTMVFPSRDFTSAATGASASTEDAVYFPSTFYLSHAFNEKLSAGLGVFNPFGLGTQWSDNWEGRYLATKSTITTYNFNPAVSYRITPELSFAAGLDVMYLDTSLENKSYPGNANQKFSGSGTGFGYNLGLAYNAGHGLSLGVSYRSEVEVDIEGNYNFGIQGINIGAKTSITLPQQLLLGVAYQVNDRFVIESGFRWEDWGSYGQLLLTVGGVPSQLIPKSWHDTFAVNIGGRYRLNDTFTLLAGYLYGWNPVPDETFEPSVPDANTHLFCIGTDMNFTRNFTFSMSYAYQLQEERNKNNLVGGGIANGSYNADIHLLGLSVAHRF